jgi:hypothetical protein
MKASIESRKHSYSKRSKACQSTTESGWQQTTYQTNCSQLELTSGFAATNFILDLRGPSALSNIEIKNWINRGREPKHSES